MNIREKLNLMKQIEEDNRKHVEDWKRKNMKIWVADYGFIDRDGNKKESDMNGSNLRDYQIQVEALDIQEALNKAKEQVSAMAYNRDWQYWTITDVGICNDNIW